MVGKQVYKEVYEIFKDKYQLSLKFPLVLI